MSQIDNESGKLKNIFFDKNIPAKVMIEITRYCNWHCHFCYLGNDRHIEMSKDIIYSLLKEIKQLGGMEIIYTGGEPLLHSNVMEVFELTKKMGFICEINTNASLISQSNYKRIASYVSKANVSIHSINPKVHDKITGKNGSWENTIRGIELLKKEGVDVTVNTVVTNLIIDECADMKHFVEEKLHCKWNPDTRIVQDYAGENERGKEYQVSDEDLLKVLEVSRLYNYHDENTYSTGICSAARTTCFVDASGNVYPCLQFKCLCGNQIKDRIESVNLKKFSDIWKNNPLFVEIRNIEKDHFKKCRNCEKYKKCFKCIAENYSNTETFIIPSEEICRREILYAQ